MGSHPRAPAWPFVGRVEELEILDDVWSSGQHSAAVLVGMAGVGKTRLMREFLGARAAEGLATDLVAATRSMMSIPFGAFAHLLDVGIGHSPVRSEMLRTAIDSIRDRSDRLVLAVDDAHFLDEGSAALVHQLAVTASAFLVVTARRGEPVSDAITALWKDEAGMRIDLQPLGASDVEGLLRSVLDGQVETATTHRLATLAEGNPMFLRELVTAGLDSGTLAQRDGVWSWDGPLVPGDLLVELVDHRLSEIAGPVRDLVELLALGEPLGEPTVAELVGRDVVVLAERHGLVATEQGGKRTNVFLAHPLYGEAIRARLGGAARRSISRRLADAMDRSGSRRRGDLLRLMTWRLDGGGAADATQLATAARTAIGLFDQPLAERLARAAAEQGAGDAAFVELTETLYWQGRFAEAERLYQTLDLERSTPGVRVALTIGRASTLFWGLGRAREAVDLLLGLDASGVEGGDEAKAHAAMIELLAGRTQHAHRYATEVLDRPEVGLRARARATGALVEALALDGRPVTAVSTARASLATALQIAGDDPSPAGAVVLGQFLGLWLGGQIGELRAFANEVYDASVQRPTDDFRGIWACLSGRALLAAGELEPAVARLRESVALLGQRDVGRILPWALGALSQAAGQLGDADQAARAAERAAATTTAIEVWAVEVEIGRAWAAAARGEMTTASAAALAAADRGQVLGQRSGELFALHEGLRLGADVDGRLRAVAESVEGDYAAVAAAEARAIEEADGPGLDAVSSGFEAAGARLLAAEAAARAAKAHDLAGHAARRVAAVERARRIRDALGRPRTPILATLDASDGVASLTRREREVAELAARGASRRQIAERLFVSERTVGNHLYRVYSKLYVNRAADLRPILGLEDAERQK